MIVILLVGFLTMSVCLVLQALFLVMAVRHFARISRHPPPSSWMIALGHLSTLMMALMVGNVVQILVWGLIYWVLGAFDTFETAAYFSGVTFTTLGYGDELLKGRFRFIAPLQAANGVMMFGLSTAALLAAVQHAMDSRRVAARALESQDA